MTTYRIIKREPVNAAEKFRVQEEKPFGRWKDLVVDYHDGTRPAIHWFDSVEEARDWIMRGCLKHLTDVDLVVETIQVL